MLARSGVCFTQAVIHSIHNKAGIRRDKKYVHGIWTETGLTSAGAGWERDSCLRERAGVGLNN